VWSTGSTKMSALLSFSMFKTSCRRNRTEREDEEEDLRSEGWLGFKGSIDIAFVATVRLIVCLHMHVYATRGQFKLLFYYVLRTLRKIFVVAKRRYYNFSVRDVTGARNTFSH